MGDIAECPVCGKEPEVRKLIICGTKVVRCVQCVTEMPPEIWKKYAAAMEHAKATIELENAMKPLDSGKRPMVKAFPRIKAAMERERECKNRVLEVFK